MNKRDGGFKIPPSPQDKNITEQKHSYNLNIASSAGEWERESKKGNEIKGKFMIISIPNKIHGAKKAAEIRKMERKITFFSLLTTNEISFRFFFAFTST